MRGAPLPERLPVALPHEAEADPRRGYVCRHCDRTTGPDTGECWARWKARAEDLERQLAVRGAA